MLDWILLLRRRSSSQPQRRANVRRRDGPRQPSPEAHNTGAITPSREKATTASREYAAVGAVAAQQRRGDSSGLANDGGWMTQQGRDGGAAG
jgi:hypothetical protein